MATSDKRFKLVVDCCAIASLLYFGILGSHQEGWKSIGGTLVFCALIGFTLYHMLAKEP